MTDADYADMALKFAEHCLWIASAMGHMGGTPGCGTLLEGGRKTYFEKHAPSGSATQPADQ